MAVLDPTLVQLIRAAVESPREEVPLALLADELLSRSDPEELRVGELIRRWISGERFTTGLADIRFVGVLSYRHSPGRRAHLHLASGIAYLPGGATRAVSGVLPRYRRLYRRPPLLVPV